MLGNPHDTDFTVEQHSSRGRIGQIPARDPRDSQSSFGALNKTLPNEVNSRMGYASALQDRVAGGYTYPDVQAR